MRLAVGTEGLMTVSLTNGAPVFEELFCSPAEIGGTEALPDKLHRLTGRMEHVFLVETVVAQLVVHQLIGWEIAHDAWILPHQPVGGKQQGGLGELAAMKTILGVSDGTHGDDDLQVFPTLPALLPGILQQVDSLLQVIGTLVYRKLALIEKRCGRFWQLSTISPVSLST